MKTIDDINKLDQLIEVTHWDCFGRGYITDYQNNPAVSRLLRVKLLKEIKEKATKSNFEVKCISDEILLYVRYIIDRVINNVYSPDGQTEIDKDIKRNIFKNKLLKSELFKQLYDLIRGNEEFSGKPPSVIAAGIAYILFKHNNTPFTQNDIHNVFLVSTTSMSDMAKLITKKYRKVYK